MQTSTITYREMTTNDIPDVHSLCELLAAEDKTDYNRDDLYNTIEKTFENGVLKAWVATLDNNIIGGIGFYVMPDILDYSRTIASEAFWYVLPECRMGVGAELLKIAENTLQVSEVSLGLKNKKLVAYLLKKGYKEIKTIVSR
jgi:hypothetical protein